MLVLKTVKEIREFRSSIPQSSIVGLVPTMGALHEGHLSLVKRARSESDTVIVSIFVNPTQFNDPEDLKKYPRNTVTDLAMLTETGTDVVFVPEIEDIYPEPDERLFDLGEIDKTMEGAHRTGHFNGVAQVVTKLFDITLPHKAYFGLKDYQQVAVIKTLVGNLNYNIDIVDCPIVREPDGLAMSSRNVRLKPDQRIQAANISRVIFKAKEMQRTMKVGKLKAWVKNTLKKIPDLEVEYFEIVDDENLQNIKSWEENNRKIGCIAVKIGEVRLIDNIIFA